MEFFKKIMIKGFKNYRLIRFLLEKLVQLRKAIILPGKLLYTGAYKYLMLYMAYRKKNIENTVNSNSRLTRGKSEVPRISS